MLTDLPLAPYLLWAKTRQPAPIDLAGSNLLHCTLDDLPGAREAVDARGAATTTAMRRWSTRSRAHYGVDSRSHRDAPRLLRRELPRRSRRSSARGDDVLDRTADLRPAHRRVPADGRRHRAASTGGSRMASDRRLTHVARRMTPRTRLIVVTTPHNPSGVSLTADTLGAAGALAESRRRASCWSTRSTSMRRRSRSARGRTTDALSRATRRPVRRHDQPDEVVRAGRPALGWAIARRRSPNASGGRATSSTTRAQRRRIGSRRSPSACCRSLRERTKAILGANLDRAREFFAAHPQLELAQSPRASVTFPRLAGVADAGAVRPARARPPRRRGRARRGSSTRRRISGSAWRDAGDAREGIGAIGAGAREHG